MGNVAKRSSGDCCSTHALGIVLLLNPVRGRRSPPPPPPPLPPVLGVALQGIADRSALFFCALLLPFQLRPPGFPLMVPKSPLPFPKDSNHLRALGPLRCALIIHTELRVLLLTVAAHFVPPLPNLTGHSTGRACTPYLLAARMLDLQKTPFAQETGCACAPPPPYPAHLEDATGVPTKPTARGKECFQMHMERNVNPHPPHWYFLSTP